MKALKSGKAKLSVKAEPPGEKPCGNTMTIDLRDIITINVCFSVGFMPDKRHFPTPDELKAFVKRINDIWAPCCIQFALVNKFFSFPKYEKGETPDDCLLCVILPDVSFADGAIGLTGLGETLNKIAGGSSLFQGPKQEGGKFNWNTDNFGLVWAHEIGHSLGLKHYSCKDDPTKKGNLMCTDFEDAGTKITDDECATAYANAMKLPATMRTQKK